MDIDHMREFLVLADHLNYTSAAKELYVSQPTLTRHINALEEALGTRLLNRTRRAVELTPTGEATVKDFKEIVKRSDQLLAKIVRLTEPTVVDLRLGMVYYGVSTFYGYPLLKAFGIRHPEVRVSTTTSKSTQIFSLLNQGAIDVGLGISSTYYVAENIKRKTVARIPLYAVMQSDNPLATRESVTLEELAQSTIILNQIPSGERNHVVDLFLRHNIELENTVYTEHIDALLYTIQTTGGIFMGSMLLTAMPQQNLIFVPIEADDFTIDVAILYLKDNDNPTIAKLIGCIDDIRKPRM